MVEQPALHDDADHGADSGNSNHDTGSGEAPPRSGPRIRAAITRFFHGLDLLDPSVVTCTRLRGETSSWGTAAPVMTYGGLSLKP